MHHIDAQVEACWITPGRVIHPAWVYVEVALVSAFRGTMTTGWAVGGGWCAGRVSPPASAAGPMCFAAAAAAAAAAGSSGSLPEDRRVWGLGSFAGKEMAVDRWDDALEFSLRLKNLRKDSRIFPVDKLYICKNFSLLHTQAIESALHCQWTYLTRAHYFVDLCLRELE